MVGLKISRTKSDEMKQKIFIFSDRVPTAAMFAIDAKDCCQYSDTTSVANFLKGITANCEVIRNQRGGIVNGIITKHTLAQMLATKKLSDQKRQFITHLHSLFEEVERERFVVPKAETPEEHVEAEIVETPEDEYKRDYTLHFDQIEKEVAQFVENNETFSPYQVYINIYDNLKKDTGYDARGVYKQKGYRKCIDYIRHEVPTMGPLILACTQKTLKELQ